MSYLREWIIFMVLFKQRKKEMSLESNSKDESKPKISVSENLNTNYMYIYEEMNSTADLKRQKIKKTNFEMMLLYLETVIDQNKLQERVMEPLLQIEEEMNAQFVMCNISINNSPIFNLMSAIEMMIDGSVLIFIEGNSSVYAVNIKSNTTRSITESTTEKTVKGAHDGFIENLNTNISLIRQRVKTSDLTIKYFTLGNKSPSKVALLYINNIVNPNVIQEIESRIELISTEFIIPSFHVESIIQDAPLSPFPQILNTERPDRVAANLFEGRAVLLEENTSNVLIMPVSFFSFYQSPDDYSSRWLLGSFFRLIRLFSFFIAIMLPSLYIAIVGFHFEMLPDELVLPIKKSIQGIPYPPILEALIMELTLELIREAGIRLPTTIGQTIGVVGGLVIGDAVVKAGLISNTMIIVVALTAIASFVVPSSEMSNSVRLLRFAFMISATILGLPGIVFAFMILTIHLCKLESFGQPYLFPIAPLNLKGLKDTFIRKPLWNKNVDIMRAKKKINIK